MEIENDQSPQIRVAQNSQSQESGIRLGENFEISDKDSNKDVFYKGRKRNNKSDS